jgi:hypothetical protein
MDKKLQKAHLLPIGLVSNTPAKTGQIKVMAIFQNPLNWSASVISNLGHFVVLCDQVFTVYIRWEVGLRMIN